ncbi:TetR/AcrR family transcriptional regulator [Butyricicoccus sp.]|uniref:TetR/AcrR family transcriptional regulator n=1 Tax=Butyricicoccus sp. TaxID=2049021 RepID=UPI003F17206A
MAEREKKYSPKEIAAFQGLFALAKDGRRFSSIKVQDIATAAGMGKGTLYEYFSSKEEILSGAIFYALNGVMNRFEQSADETLSFRQTLERFFGELDGDVPFAALSMLVASMAPEQREEIRARGQEDMSMVFSRMKQAEARAFSAGRISGEIDPSLDDSFCEYTVVSAMFGQAAAHMFACQEQERQIPWAMLVDMICRTLRP